MTPRSREQREPALELATLLAACRDGDELAWEALVRRYQGRVLALARAYTGDPEEARDLTQAIFVKVYRRLPACRDAGRFLPWLLRLARNHCLDQLRRRRARPPARDIPAEDLVNLASSRPGPEEEREAAERRRLVWQALAGLDDRNREVLVLHEMQGLPVEEIGSLLGVPVGTVKSRRHRARLELARIVRDLLAATREAEA